jgi:hypothetical protein
VPHLTQGLIDICKTVPKDPFDFLADYLLLKADEIDKMRVAEREAAIKLKPGINSVFLLPIKKK